MSDEKDPIADFKENMAHVAELETLKKETADKKVVLDHKRVTTQLKNLEENEHDLEIMKNSNFGALSAEQIKKIQDENDAYMTAAQNGLRFINEVFDGVVPFFRKNLILVGAETGNGKSTTVANVAYEALKTKSKLTGKVLTTLIITNEEKAEDFYNRITCLNKGWHYTNHDKFTTEQKNTFREMIPVLAGGGRLTVIDNNHDGSHGVTTTVEGIENIFENLLRNKHYYDVVVIDYYQNINSSKKDPSMTENDAQAKLSRMLDRYKNIYPAPIVMMAQVNPQTKDEKTPFQMRIKGRKIIMDVCTFVVEMSRDTENLRTQWTVWKSRFTEAIGKSFYTGYQKGRFVKYDNTFIEGVEKMKYEKTRKEQDKLIGIKDVFKEGEHGTEGSGSSET